MQTITQLFPISPTDKRAGILLLPDDYSTNSAFCPLIVFSHGVGEAGDGTLATVASLYNNGSPLAQGRAGLLNSITCPVTGIVYRPAIFALQGTQGWCVQAPDIAYAIKQLQKAYPRLDPVGALKTGLSAGGEVTWEAIGGADFGLYAAGVPMSTPPINGPAVDWSRAIGKVWAIHGGNDGGIISFSNSQQLTAKVNAAHPGFANLTLVPGEGHDSGLWTLGYTPTNRWPFAFAWDGKTPTSKSINIYEFWMACRNANFLFSSTPVIVAPVTSALKAVPVISVQGNIATLDGSLSTGIIATYDWYITKDTGEYAGMGLPTTLRKLSATLKPGNYVARLDVQAADGTKSRVSQNFSVGAIVPVPPVFPVVFTLNGNTFTLAADGTWK